MIKALIALVVLGIASQAQAQSYSRQRIGNFDYVNGPNGYQGTGQRIGQFYYYHDNYGSGTGQQIGQFQYYNYTPNRRW